MSCLVALHARQLLRPQHMVRLKDRPLIMMQTTTSLTHAPTPRCRRPEGTPLSGQPYSTSPSLFQKQCDAPSPPHPAASRLPLSTWDTHMHLIEPAAFPLSPNAKYTPATHSLPQALSFYASHPLLSPISNLVIVQPSVYGTDNSCTLTALGALGPDRGRAVVALPPDASSETLFAWHGLGVRGVRLNFKSIGREVTKDELATELRAAADAVRGFGWAVQLYLGLESVPLLEEIVSEDLPLGVKLVVDHIGHPTLPESSSSSSGGGQGDAATDHDPYALPGFASLVRLVRGTKSRRSNTWVKLSAAYRIERDPSLPWVGAMARELLREAPERVVFATDWPHTRFDGYDVVPFVEKCLEWCGGDAALEKRLFRRNAEELFDVRR